MKLLLIFVFCTIAWGKVFPNNRIVGGRLTTIDKHPYQVSLRYNDQHICGGSIVNENTVVTAAHCIVGMEEEINLLSIRVGSSYQNVGTQYNLSSFHTHEEFGVGVQSSNDIAVIILDRNLTFSSRVRPIAVQPANTPVPEGTEVVVSGWGTTIPGLPLTPLQLREVELDVITNSQCEEMYAGYREISSSMLCARRLLKDSCTGDSGGPLVAGDVLVGVVSWGRSCADPRYPGVYANVTTLRQFLDPYL